MKTMITKIVTTKPFVFDDYGERYHYPTGTEGALAENGEVQFSDGNQFMVPGDHYALTDDQPNAEIFDHVADEEGEGVQ